MKIRHFLLLFKGKGKNSLFQPFVTAFCVRCGSAAVRNRDEEKRISG